jgi:glycosyltransferase involved in cell wall biosynthesis
MTSRATSEDSLRLLVLSETDWLGGAEVVTRDLAMSLAERGWTVRFGGPESGTGWLSSSLRQYGIPTFQYPFPSAVNWSCVSALLSEIRSFRPSVVHTHEFSMAVYGMLASRIAGVPHVFTLHGNPGVLEAARRRWALRVAAKLSTGVAVSEATRRDYCDAIGIPRESFTVVSNGVPMPVSSSNDVRLELGIGSSTRVLLALGTLTHRKGHVDLIRACARLSPNTDWHLLIAGRADDAAEETARTIAECGLTRSVSLLGVRSDTGDLLAACDVFVMPSRWEGLPLAVLEAMHAGRPIVATRCNGIPEAVTHESTGLLVEPGDVEGITVSLQRLLDNSELSALLGARAAADATRRFSIGAMARSYDELLRSLAKPIP